MVAGRPVDAIDHTKLGMAMQRTEAIASLRCLKCCRVPEFRDAAEAREFGISGLCEDCWTAIFAEEDGDDCE